MWRGINESVANIADEIVREAMTFLENRAEARDAPGVGNRGVNLTAVNIDSSTPVLPARWRTMRSAPASGAHNMAVDSVLLAAARDAHAVGVWRTYAWSAPTISFGRHEAARAHFSAASIAAAELSAVRRPTGGRALLHGGDVTYSVAMPLDSRTPWTAAYRAVNAVLLAALRALGVDAHLALAAATPSVRPDGALCFAQPARGEIVVDGAKLVGSAVWREHGAYLQHGSILLRDCQAELLGAMRRNNDISDENAHGDVVGSHALEHAATLAGCLPRVPTWSAVASALESALTNHVTAHSDGKIDDAPPILDEDVLARETQRFSDATWLWRR